MVKLIVTVDYTITRAQAIMLRRAHSSVGTSISITDRTGIALERRKLIYPAHYHAAKYQRVYITDLGIIALEEYNSVIAKSLLL